MKMFMFKAMLLASIMFICVLTGMQFANNGIHEMKGYQDPAFKSAFTVKEGEKDGEVEAAILGNRLTSHDLKQKKEQLEKMETFNFFSAIGKKIAEGFEVAVGKSIEKLTDK